MFFLFILGGMLGGSFLFSFLFLSSFLALAVALTRRESSVLAEDEAR